MKLDFLSAFHKLLNYIMTTWKKTLFYILLGISFLGIPIFAFGILNTMVSQKYETKDPADCISHVTGQDLCLSIVVFEFLIFICIVFTLLLIIFRKRILK